MGNSLVGRVAPDFTAEAIVCGTISPLSLHQLRGRYVILFFYPLDFTFVCPTELHAFQEALNFFESRNAQLLGCSVDSIYAHSAWLNIPRSKGGIEGVTYPLISDLNKSIAISYGILKEEAGVAYRALFLIDKNGVVRHQLVNDLSLGRSVEEAIRILDALIFSEEHGEVCPANWQKGKKAIKPNKKGLEDYLIVK